MARVLMTNIIVAVGATFIPEIGVVTNLAIDEAEISVFDSSRA